jgi:hypothetical protein
MFEGKLTEVKLDHRWMNENFNQEQKDYFITLANNECTKFLELPVGNLKTVVPTMNINCNPTIFYQNNQEAVCIFAAFASVLQYRGFCELASAIMEYSSDDRSKLYKKNNAMSEIFDFVQTRKVARSFRKRYQPQKIQKQSRQFLFDNYAEMDILLVVMEQTNFNCSHAVAITENYIFDSNATNALPRTEEGIDCCCGDSSFQRFSKGYIWKAGKLASKMLSVR